MSRFFNNPDASESETESSSSEENVSMMRPAMQGVFTPLSDDEEVTKRIVRSTKEKRYEELNNNIRNVQNHRKNKNVSGLLTSFDELCKIYAKSQHVILKEGGGDVPRFYIRCLVELEDFINNLWDDKAARKNLPKNDLKCLTPLYQKLKKYLQDFQEEMTEFRENPQDELESEDEKDEDSEDAEIIQDSFKHDSFKNDSFKNDSFKNDSFKKELPETKEPKVSQKVMPRPSAFLRDEATEGDDSDSIDWDNESEETTSSSEDETKYTSLRDRFKKKPAKEEEMEKKAEKKEKRDREERRQRRLMKEWEEEEQQDEQAGWTKVKGGSQISAKPKMFAKDAEINHPLVLKKLNEIMAARGKKGTDRKEQVEMLQELHSISDAHNLGPAMSCKILFAINAAIFDYNPKISNAMKAEYWEKILIKTNELLDLLLKTPELAIGEYVTDDCESYERPPYRIRGCVLTVVERLDEEFVKILKECDAHSNEYVERLKDETKICEIIDQLQIYIERQEISSEMCRINLRKIEHTYYKFDSTVLEKRQGKLPPDTITSLDIMDKLCKYIYAKDSTDRLRTQAILCHIYHHALHDNWYEARDLMLMSHLQDTIHHSDPPTQILYNRTMVQLGLCSFRHANIKDAHNALLDIQLGGRAKELLAQGLLPQVRRQHDRTSEQEKVEKQRQMPFHKHINLELLECVYLVSAMLMEIPYMAAHEFDARRRMISKSFYQQLRSSERQSLIGPPESMREHVVAASKAMRNGNWKACKNFIINEKMNAKVWDLFYQADKVRDMLTKKIQEEALRTYLFTYSNVYDSISMVTLAEMFELDRAVVHSIISKMIINEELMASLDEPTSSVVMHRTEPTRLQSLALQLADKVANLVENNERVLEMKQGTFYSRNLQQGGYRDRQGGGNFRRDRDRDRGDSDNRNWGRRDRQTPY